MADVIICETCIQVHGRDTNTAVQCEVCGKIVGCFWHKKDMLHIRNCFRAQAGLPPLEPFTWEEEVDETGRA